MAIRLRTFEENRPYLEPGRSRRAFPQMDLKARHRAPRSRLDPHHGIPDEVAAVAVPSSDRIARDEEKGRRVSVAAPSPEVVAPGDPSVWPHGSAREGPARMTWNVSARLLATCSSGPGGPPATVRCFCLPFLGRAAAQRSDAPAPRSTPGKVRRAADPSETTSSLYGVLPFSAGV